jgi:phosphohistidine swiveling domain-containing protein
MYLNDRSSLLDSKITQEQFLIKYGHLRSGTYDITSLPYSKNIEFAIGGSSRVTGHIETNNAELLLGMKPLLDRIAMDLSIENVDLIFEFLQEAIGARENYKFIYSKAVSEILEKIVDFGTIYGLNRRDLQFITIEDISHIATMESPIEVRDFLNVTFKGRRDIYNLNSKMILPEIVFEENDFYTFDSHSARPNYVTNKSVKSQTIYLDSAQRVDLKGKIIIIENADPGYDWIFNHGIVGLITKYGGAASHMSIRCSELGVPAAIGTGELLFDKIVLAKELLLDAKNQKIEVFQ